MQRKGPTTKTHTHDLATKLSETCEHNDLENESARRVPSLLYGCVPKSAQPFPGGIFVPARLPFAGLGVYGSPRRTSEGLLGFALPVVVFIRRLTVWAH